MTIDGGALGTRVGIVAKGSRETAKKLNIGVRAVSEVKVNSHAPSEGKVDRNNDTGSNRHSSSNKGLGYVSLHHRISGETLVVEAVVQRISSVSSLAMESSIETEVVNTKETGDSVNRSKHRQVYGSHDPLMGTCPSLMGGLNFNVIPLMEGA
ncbi:hypothetical protein V6N13_101166 [Hibiscus sabdariffa]